MKFIHYFNLSLLGTLALVGYALYSREQFYPIILFLVTSKVSFVVAGNMVLATALLLGHISKSIFLGQLRDAEIELLTERAKYTVTETCLALTIFRNELTPSILGLFGVLLFLKAFHWLAKSRLEHLEHVMPVGYLAHLRLSSLIAVLCAADVALAYSCMAYTLEFGKSVLILFSFEFGLLVIDIFNLSNRYCLHLADARLPNGLPSKTLYVMMVDLACDAMRFVTYVIFFSLVFVYYGLPIHLIRELWMSYHTLHRRLVSFVKYLRLTNNLDQRFADATPEEVEACGDCLICRERIERGKKLPCSHVFHLECLRMWLQHQQTCPLCRADIPVQTTAAVANDGAGAGAGAADVAVAAAAAAAAAGDAAAENAGAGAAGGAAAGGAGASEGGGALPFPAAAGALGTPGAEAEGIAETPAALPAFFLVTAPEIAVHASASSLSSTLRTVSRGVVVFVTARQATPQGAWLRLPDGWVSEWSTEGPRLVPYVPPPEPLSRRFQSPLLPQPAAGYSRTGTSASTSSSSSRSSSSGGGSARASATTPVAGLTPTSSSRTPGNRVNLCFRCTQAPHALSRILVERDATVLQMREGYANLLRLPPARVQFLRGGQELSSAATPASLGLADHDQIDVVTLPDTSFANATPQGKLSTFGVPFSGSLGPGDALPASPFAMQSAPPSRTAQPMTPASPSLSTMISLQERLQGITADLARMQQTVGACQASLSEIVKGE